MNHITAKSTNSMKNMKTGYSLFGFVWPSIRNRTVAKRFTPKTNINVPSKEYAINSYDSFCKLCPTKNPYMNAARYRIYFISFNSSTKNESFNTILSIMNPQHSCFVK